MENNKLLLPVYTEHMQGLLPTEKQNGFLLSGSIEFAAVFESFFFFMSTSSDFDIMLPVVRSTVLVHQHPPNLKETGT